LSGFAFGVAVALAGDAEVEVKYLGDPHGLENEVSRGRCWEEMKARTRHCARVCLAARLGAMLDVVERGKREQ
jgi:hypothetical protein